MNLFYPIALLVYFLLILLAGLVFSRRMKTLEDFFLASRSLPATLVGISLCASWFGATSILVSSDEAYRSGVSAFWLVGMPAVLTLVLLMVFLAPSIHRLPGLSLPDLVEERYGRLVRHLASILIIWYMVILASSQMVALGNFLKSFLGTSYLISIFLGTSVVLLYSVLGGFFSVVATDCFKLSFLSAAMLGLLGFLFFKWNSSGIFPGNPAREAGVFNFFSGFGRNSLVALSFLLAWLISPIAWQRIQAAKSCQKARQGLGAAAVALLILYGAVILIGIFFSLLYQPSALGSPVLSEFISTKAGPIWGGFLFVAVVGAILSTLDTAINAGALSLARDVFQQFGGKTHSGKAVFSSRLATVVVAAASLAVAMRFQDILRTLGLASEVMAEGLFVPGMAMIYLKKKLPSAGLASLLAGGGFALLSFLGEWGLPAPGIPTWPYSVPYGLALSLAGFFIGAGIDMFKKADSGRSRNSCA